MSINNRVFFLFDRINRTIFGVWVDYSGILNALSWFENHWKTQGDTFSFERDSLSEPPYTMTKFLIDGDKSSELIIFEADYIDTIYHVDIPTYHLADNVLLAFAQKWGVKTDDPEEPNFDVLGKGLGFLTYLTFSPYGRFLFIAFKDRSLIYRRKSISPFLPLPNEIPAS